MSMEITTSILRDRYSQGRYSFGVEGARKAVCLVGSCRILPYLNMLLAINESSNDPMEFLCYDPIECWSPGITGTDYVGEALGSHKIGEVDWLICEHLVNCGVLNTREECSENVFKDLYCRPKNPVIRVPNWNGMFIFDEELASIRPAYAAATGVERVEILRDQTLDDKSRFMGYCMQSSFPELAGWVNENWTKVRMGLTSNHSTFALALKIFDLVAERMGLEVLGETMQDAAFTGGYFGGARRTKLTACDYSANNWEF